MGESYELSYEIKEAIENAYLTSWSYGSGPRVDHCGVDVYFHPNKAIVSGQITFYYTTPNYSLKSDFDNAARRAVENIRTAIWNRIRITPIAMTMNGSRGIGISISPTSNSA